MFADAVVQHPNASAMRLLTHNLLACHAKGCGNSSKNFPLQLRNVQLELIEADYNDAFLKGFLPKLHWPALVGAARQLGQTSLPEQEPDFTQQEPSDELLQALHHILLEVRCLARSHLAAYRRGRNGVPQLRARVHNSQRDSQHGTYPGATLTPSS